MERLTIVKVGGKVVEEKESLDLLLNQVAQIRGKADFGAWWRKTGYHSVR